MQELVEFVVATSVSELDLRDGELRVSLKRHPTTPASPTSSSEAVAWDDEGLAHVTAPLLGSFFRAPSPTAEPFVHVGERVEVGQVVGLIEAMKIFNEIQADVSGWVRAILVEDGAFVEADQRLMAIDPVGPGNIGG